MPQQAKPVVLTILDGWGESDAIEHNAIRAADTPNMDRLAAEFATAHIDASGIAVGLPSGQMGNSEVGHLNLGAGRVVYQDYTRISKAVADDELRDNAVLTKGIQQAVDKQQAVHLIGLLSPGGVHSHEEHIHATAQLAADLGATQVYVHAFLDGRDMPPRSAKPSIEKMDALLSKLNVGHVASICGRYYAMDRDQRWDRVQQAYDLMTAATAEHTADSALAGLEAAYARDENDEFVKATRIADANGDFATINDGDTVIFMNYRADRARQLTRCFIEDDFDGFDRAQYPSSHFICLTQYQASFDTPVAFEPLELHNSLGEYVANLGLSQLRIAETEKYAHVTFFFSGGREETFKGEERKLIPSPQVATYDLQPEMSAPEVTAQLVSAIEAQAYDLIICNFANPDMVGHTGNFDAAVKAIEAVDKAVGEVAAALQKVGGELLVTADHGNCEQMFDGSTEQAHTAHTTNLVPLIYMGRKATLSDGVLSDIAPTLLQMMNLGQPAEMTGKPLISWA